MGESYAHSVRVRWAECDPQGVVFNAHYLAYVDLSITELWRAAFGSYDAMLARGVDIVVAHAELRFLSPARFDDELSLEVGVTHMGTTSIVTTHWFRRDEELLLEASVRHVFVGRETLTKTAIPEWARIGLAPWGVVPAPAG